MPKRANGEGMIRQRPDGLWEARIRIEGKPKSFYGKTQKEVREKLQGIRQDVSEGRPVITDRLTVADYLDRWLTDVVAVKNAPKTAKDYEMIVRVHIVPTFGKTQLKSLAAPDIQRWVNALAKDHSPRTVAYYRACLRAALNHAVKWKLLAHNPAAVTEVPQQKKKRVEAMSRLQAKTTLAAFEGHHQETLVTLLLLTGMRPGEALGLTWHSVDFDEGVIRVQTARSGQLKRESAWRVLVLPEVVARQLKALPRHGELVFPTRTGKMQDGTTVLHQFQHRLADAGLPKMTLYALRHGHATLQLTGGATLREIMEQLGHTQISTTANIYTHVSAEVKRKSADRMNEMFGSYGLELGDT